MYSIDSATAIYMYSTRAVLTTMKLLLGFLLLSTLTIQAFQCHQALPQRPRDWLRIRGGDRSRLQLSPTAASLLAGSIAGAIGVGVAFPLDTLKTKAQVYPSDGLLATIRTVLSTEGIRGFFPGVRLVMVGQASIKACAFCANAYGLRLFARYSRWRLVLAACFAGWVTTFLVVPVERIKIVLQAQDYANVGACIQDIVHKGGWLDLCFRGWMTTVAREIPGYALYFVTAGLLKQYLQAYAWGPLVAGAAAGCAAWIPVYPLDVVKTLVQNTDSSSRLSTRQVVRHIWNEQGPGGFFDGLTPKLLRAMVNHAVTFAIYEKLMEYLL